MELKITNENANSLFERKEITATVISPATPSKDEIKKILSEKFASAPETVRVLEIQGCFGSSEFSIKANIYKSKEMLGEIERRSKKEKESDAKIPEVLEEPAKEVESPKENSEVPAEKTEAPKEEPKSEEAKE